MCLRFVSWALLAVLAADAEEQHQGDCPAGSPLCGATEEASLLQLRGKDKPVHRGPSCVEDHEEPAEIPEYSDVIDFEVENETVEERESCKLTSGSCPIQSFTDGKFVDIYPAGPTACLDGSDYFFTVRLGDPEKLHIHFQGGGACWDLGSFALGLCFKHVYPQSQKGAFNISDASNPWANYSFVIINYCSGDLHGGNTNKHWTLFKRNKVRGFYNAQSAVEYVEKNFPALKKLTISGSSAGSLGVQLWSRHLLEIISDRAEDIAVVADSFIGVIYPPTEARASESFLFNDWNMCNPVLLNEDELKLCKDNNLRLGDTFVDAMKKNPAVRFAATNSKWDIVQIGFEKAFELSRGNKVGAEMTAAQFYHVASQTLESWMKEKNFHTYLVRAVMHTYLPKAYIYTTTPRGTVAADDDGTGPAMIQWLTELVNPPEDPMRTVCWGPVRELGDDPTLNTWFDNYCTAELAGYTNATSAL